MDAKEIMDRLQAPFPAKDIEWRIQRTAKTRSGGARALVLAYITARAVMDRLDEVFGPGGWSDHYEEYGKNSVKATLSVKIGDEWIAKQDAADNTQIESTKGGISDSLKRVAVKWGIGRYLYKLPETWVDIKQSGEHYVNDKKTGVSGYWDTPQLPEWALPEDERGKQKAGTQRQSKPPGEPDDRTQLIAIVQSLAKEKGWTPEMISKGCQKYYRKNGVTELTEGELQNLIDRISQAQGGE